VKIVCAWCGKEMGEKPPLGDKSITHSICPKCKEKHFNEKRKRKEADEQFIKKPNTFLCFVADRAANEKLIG